MDLIIVLFGIIIFTLSIAIGVWVWRRVLSGSVERNNSTANLHTDMIASYRAVYDNNSWKSETHRAEFYIDPNKVWLEKSGKTRFVLKLEDIDQVSYDRFTVLLKNKNGQEHLLYALREPAHLIGVYEDSLFVSNSFHAKKALSSFLADMNTIGITPVKRADPIKPPGYYIIRMIGVAVVSLIVAVIVAMYI